MPSDNGLEIAHIAVSLGTTAVVAALAYMGLYVKNQVVDSVSSLKSDIMGKLGDIRETQVEIKGEVKGHIDKDEVVHQGFDRRIERLEGNRH